MDYDRDRERERKAEYRAKKKQAEEAEARSEQAMGALERQEAEQAVRDHYGYAKSETRTWHEREQTADRIRQKTGVPVIDMKARYIESAVLGAELVSRRRDESPEVSRQRTGRAVRYAEWRWDGFHAGEIASF